MTALAPQRRTAAGRYGDDTLPATMALAGLTLAAAVSMGRLFADGSYLLPLVVAAVVTHAVCWLGRRSGVSLFLTAMGAVAALALCIAWVILPETTVYGVPAVATLRAAMAELSEARDVFARVVAPAPVVKGFLISAMAAVGVAGILGDWAAFRVRAPWQAAAPSFVILLFTGLLGTAEGRVPSVALFVAALLVFLLAAEGQAAATSHSWLAGRAGGGSAWRWRSGAALAVAAVAATAVLGPRLPGTDLPAALAWRHGNGAGEGSRVTVSPLVDIRDRLVQQSKSEVFSVRSNVRTYWRLTSLDTFDGQAWTSNASYQRVLGPLPAVAPGRDAERAVQEFTIGSLSSTWLPAAYRPHRLRGLPGVRYNDDLASLVAPTETAPGLTYRVESIVPRRSAQALAGAGPSPPGRPLERFRRLPGVSGPVRHLAQRLTADEPTLLGKALALQAFFQREFTYDLDARPGHDERALESFLFRSRRGYCEQFAGAYAVLARLAGLPTRVAVGFTPGELGSDGRYHVRGLNAHAWPEVYLEGFGWVNFEPTPGRGAPGDTAHTGLPEAQARVEEPATATTTPSPATSEAGETGPATTAPAEEEAGDSPSEADEARRRSLPGLALALVAAVVVLGGIPLLKRARRRRRRASATSPEDRVLVAWAETDEALARSGLPRRRAETLDEHARRAALTGPLSGPASTALAELAGAAAVASYGARPLAEPDATRAVAAAVTVQDFLRTSTSLPEQLRHTVDPRPLLRALAGAVTGPGPRSSRRDADKPGGRN